jgi:hypothetical protein
MSTSSALTRARDHAGAALSSLGEAAEELAHEARELFDRELPVLREKAAETVGELASRAEGAVGELASGAEHLLDSDRIVAARKELAARIDPGGPSPKRWWWIGAGVAVTVASLIGWFVLSRRPQEQPHEEAPSTNPPATVDLEPETPAPAARNGHS